MNRSVVLIPSCLLLGLAAWASVSVAAEPPVTAMAFDATGKLLVVGSQAGLRVRRWPGLDRVRRIACTLSHVHDLAFSPDASRLAVAGGTPAEHGRVELRSWPEGRLLRRLEGHDDLVYGVAWSPDGKRLATGGFDHRIRIHDLNRKDPGKLLEGHSRGVTAIAFSPSGQRLFSVGRDHSLRCWDIGPATLRRTLDNHTAAVHAVAVRPSAAKAGGGGPLVVATAAADRTVRLWQPEIGRLVRFARLPSIPLCLAWNPEGTLLMAGCRDGHLRVIDARSVKVTADHPALPGWAWSLAVHPDGRSVAVGGVGGRVARIVLASPR